MEIHAESVEAQVEQWRADRIAFGLTRSAGARLEAVFKETLGARFGALLVLSYAGSTLRQRPRGVLVFWRVQCDCGRIVERMRAQELRAAKTCGGCLGRGLVLSELTLRRAALAIETEGCLGVYGNDHATRPMIEIGVTTPMLLERFAQEVGCGVLSPHGRATDVRAASMKWAVAGGEAMTLARAVEPYLITKFRQARVVAACPRSRHGVRFSEGQRAWLTQCRILTRAFNHSGPHVYSPFGAEERVDEWYRWIRAAPRPDALSALACAIDFEGSIFAVQRDRSVEAVIDLANVTRRTALVRVVAALAGVGNVRPRNAFQPGEADRMTWKVTGPAASTLAAELVPHLVLKRKQAEILASFPAGIAPRSDAASELQVLNLRGPDDLDC